MALFQLRCEIEQLAQTDKKKTIFQYRCMQLKDLLY